MWNMLGSPTASTPRARYGWEGPGWRERVTPGGVGAVQRNGWVLQGKRRRVRRRNKIRSVFPAGQGPERPNGPALFWPPKSEAADEADRPPPRILTSKLQLKPAEALDGFGHQGVLVGLGCGQVGDRKAQVWPGVVPRHAAH